MSEPTRREREGVEFPHATWTTFDRYDRYGAIARAIRSCRGPGTTRVLDVGDAAGYLALFDPDVALVGIDVAVQPDRLPGSVALAADGARLPFPDASFDAVVSSDVLEHVPPAGRPAFLAELSRVSADLVVVAAPFDTPGVAGVEELVRRFALLALGRPQEQLDEHQENGLPSLGDTASALAAHGEVVTAGNGNLWDWFQLMLVKHQLLARPALLPLHDAVDALYNLSLSGRAADAPYYRHLVVARRSGPIELGTPAGPSAPPDVLAAVLASLVAATDPESTRQDVVGALAETRVQVDQLLGTTAALHEKLDHRVDHLEAELAELRRSTERIEAFIERVLRPIRRLRGRGGEPVR